MWKKDQTKHNAGVRQGTAANHDLIRMLFSGKRFAEKDYCWRDMCVSNLKHPVTVQLVANPTFEGLEKSRFYVAWRGDEEVKGNTIGHIEYKSQG